MFHALFFASTLVLQVSKQPALFFPSLPANAFVTYPSLVNLVAIVAIIFVVLVLAWLVWFVRATVTTSRFLRRLPYQPTRFQQLSFRFMLFQQFVVSRVFCVCVAWSNSTLASL